MQDELSEVSQEKVATSRCFQALPRGLRLFNRAGSSSVLSQMEQSLRKRLRLSSPGQQISKNQENLTM